MDLSYGPEAEAARGEVRAFLKQEWKPGDRRKDVLKAYLRDFRTRATDAGYLYRSVPKRYGGSEQPVDVVKAQVIREEFARARAPMDVGGNGMNMLVPTLLERGTEEQRQALIRPTIAGDYVWGQGYSEPGSGSDLASLKTRAIRDGDDYVVDGTKIWTTHAHEANWVFLLVRTAKDGPKQAGISFLLCPMDAPGLTVTPIRSMSGEHEVNQVFLDNVRVPVAHRVGEENQGWTIAKYLLTFERGGGSAAGRLNAQLAKLKTIARTQPGDGGGTLWDDAGFRERIMRIETEILAIDWTERRQIASRGAGEVGNNTLASILKLTASEATQKLAQLTSEALGPYAAADQRHALGVAANEPTIGPDHGLTATARYLNTRAATIFGGSSEVQRNIIAKGLGL